MFTQQHLEFILGRTPGRNFASSFMRVIVNY